MSILGSLSILKLEEIQGGHTGIEVKMKSLLASCLAIGETRKLFGIPEEKLNLKAGLIEPVNFQGGEVRVRRK